MRPALVAALLLALVLPATASAAPELIRLGEFTAPVAIAAPPGDPRRVFVVERAGTIRLVRDGAVQPVAFANLTQGVRQTGYEEGLLGMAFAPDYAVSGLAYVFLVSPDGSHLEIRELQRSADPDRAVAGAGRLVLAVQHTQASNHNGGQLAFGPDGLLYAATGDGGNSNDTENDAANTTSLLGKILRIDPRAHAGGAYSVPATNPFGNEVWAYGLRNPWRFSFDRATGDLLIGDVGQGVREEIDWAPAHAGGGRGVNFGWRCWEGSVPTPSVNGDRSSPPLCSSLPAAQPPAIERDHNADGFAAIVGGFVVRDPGLPTLAGRYLFGDNVHAGLQSAVLGSAAAPTETGLSVPQLTSFGEDACGRLYTASLTGPVYRIQDGAPSTCGTAAAPPPRAPAPGAGTNASPCDLRVTFKNRQRIIRRGKRLRIRLRAGKPCTAIVRAKRFRTETVVIGEDSRRVVRLKPTERGLRRLRRALRHSTKKRVRVAVTISARDTTGVFGARRVYPRVR